MEQKKAVSINLKNEYAPWDKIMMGDSYSLWTRGYAFIDDCCHSGDSLNLYVSDCLQGVPPEARIPFLKSLIPQLNGCWALVYESDSFVLAAVDRLRSIPLFYGMENGKAFLSDDAREVLKCLNNAEIDDTCAAEFLLTGYVTGRDTLYKGLYQVQPGGILEVTAPENASAEITTHRYYRYISGNYFDADEHELEEELSRLWHRMFGRYATALKGKTPVVPLSGGLDSRLMVAMLKNCGLENVICFSYGSHGNYEAEASRAVAKALGYKWLFCPYDESLWYKWFREDQLRKYIDYGSNYSSSAHLQDWPATRKILDDISCTDSVFIPGHTGDFLTGGHIPSELFEAEENTESYDTLIPRVVLLHHYVSWPWRKVCPELEDPFIGRVKIVLPYSSFSDRSEAIGAYEAWEYESRQARFIINSVRVYEFFNCQWMLPWWDYELMDFFLRIRLDLRYGKRLYKNTLIHKIFASELSKLAEIPVAGPPLIESRIQRARCFSSCHSIHSCLKKITPRFVKSNLAYLLNKKRGNPLALYGRYIDSESKHTTLSSFVGSVDAMPDTVGQILRPNLSRNVLRCSTKGINSAYYFKSLT